MLEVELHLSFGVYRCVVTPHKVQGQYHGYAYEFSRLPGQGDVYPVHSGTSWLIWYTDGTLRCPPLHKHSAQRPAYMYEIEVEVARHVVVNV